MFGRTVPGPLQLVKSAWLQETDLSSAKQNVVKFILNTRELLRHALELASTHAAQERSKAKVWYDRRARLRTFQPGDKDLVLIPCQGSPCMPRQACSYLPSRRASPPLCPVPSYTAR